LDLLGFLGEIFMDQASSSTTTGARRDEDIALDLLKFVASATSIIRPAAPSTGFTAVSGAKPEEQVNQLLDLYGRCLGAVQGVTSTTAKGASR
jgi:hypothetical protein